MKKDGLWIDEGSGRIVDTFTLPPPKPRFRRGDLAVRVGTLDVYQVLECEVSESRSRLEYLAQKVTILESRGKLTTCAVAPVRRFEDSELQPLPPGSPLLEPTRPAVRRYTTDLASSPPQLPHQPKASAATSPAVPALAKLMIEERP